MSHETKQQCVSSFIFRRESGEVYYRDKMIDPTPLAYSILLSALDALKPGEELIAVQWFGSRGMNVWLSQDDTIYEGSEAQGIYRSTYRFNLEGHQEMPVISVPSWDPDAVLSAEALAKAQRLSSTTTDRGPQVPLTLTEIIEGLDRYVGALRVLVHAQEDVAGD